MTTQQETAEYLSTLRQLATEGRDMHNDSAPEHIVCVALLKALDRIEELTQPAPKAINVPLTRGPSGELLEAAQPAPQDDSKAYPLPQHLNVTTHKDGTILAVTVNDSDGRVVQVLAEAPQPAPLALSPDLAQIWATRVIQARGSVARTGIDEALLAVDALLKQRVTPLTKDDFDAWWDADALTQTNPYSEGSPVF